ncbi:Uncharacterized conserved protein YecT, DUF1311 family [Halopseudomonas litoralis]|uniref:Uncharacterized conserved protein YecT, DUF1311 family n=1 Tax=Halopseudomonas litoralis TaxID=797277 RepID=A0A1H1PMX5_9GAMM|nr:lysozyme inhibitor LprI family protein [Halopseudomonas litoralis]SDS12631.1 Uncharacterized conserved protein YecT, DUF1311 family [Halopseudomonas litoralis]
MKYFALAVFIVLSAPSLASADSLCTDAESTSDMRECLNELNREANILMEQYLTAAIERYGDDEVVVAGIRSAQAAWEAYRSAHCDSVFSAWRDGSIRFDMASLCGTYTTRMRTHDIWREFLTYMDSSHPVLPEPELMLGQ